MIAAGARIVVTDPGSPCRGEYGTVTVDEYPAILTGRPMVDVHLDDHQAWDDEGFYVSQVDELRIAVAS